MYANMLHWHNCTSVVSCRPERHVQTIDVWRTRKEHYVKLTSIPRHHCTLTCLSRSECSLINYNHLDHNCFMTGDRCIRMELDNGFEIIYYGATGESCLSWASLSQYQQSLAVTQATSGEIWKLWSYFDLPEYQALTWFVLNSHTNTTVWMFVHDRSWNIDNSLLHTLYDRTICL